MDEMAQLMDHHIVRMASFSLMMFQLKVAYHLPQRDLKSPNASSTRRSAASGLSCCESLQCSCTKSPTAEFVAGLLFSLLGGTDSCLEVSPRKADALPIPSCTFRRYEGVQRLATDSSLVFWGNSLEFSTLITIQGAVLMKLPGSRRGLGDLAPGGPLPTMSAVRLWERTLPSQTQHHSGWRSFADLASSRQAIATAATVPSPLIMGADLGA